MGIKRTSLVLALIALTAPVAALARERFYESTPAEDATLPRYCADAMLGPNGYGGPGQNPAAAHWVSIMGNGFWTIHHYCRGLLLRMRSQRFDLSAQQRSSMQKGAVDDFDYVLKNTGPDFVLRPEILVRKGETLVSLHQYRDAETAFQEAARAKQDYWPAYLDLAELYRSQNQIDLARSTVEEGLIHAPHSKSLARLRQQLSGDKPPPAPARSREAR